MTGGCLTRREVRSAMAPGLDGIDHIVVAILENRSFDHLLGYLYSGSGNVSPAGDAFAGLACPGLGPRRELVN